MPIDSRNLALYSYNSANGLSQGAYNLKLDQLRFTTIAPGGYGDLSCRVRVNTARLISNDLALMSNVALMGAKFPAFLGRWEEPAIALDQSDGDLYELRAQGAATGLKDDPDSVAYTNQTAQYIIGQEFSRRSNYLLLDSDQSQVLPNAPSILFSPTFDGKDLEEELNELSPMLGDYQWCVWAHGGHLDVGGFPTWQLYWHQRDTSTVSYTAWIEDEQQFRVTPAMEYAYNVVQVQYRDITTNLPSSVTVSDGRLNGNGSQGTAPFSRRKLRKDLSAYHLSATQATAIANALLAQYQNGGWKIDITLHSVGDATGNPLPLWQVRADANILLPNLVAFGPSLPVGWTPNQTVFYITETEYDEQEGQTPTLKLTCNTFYDKAGFQIARLQYREEHRIKSGKHRQNVQIPGEQDTGQCGASWGANAAAGDTYETGVNYGKLLSNTPTNITLATNSSTNTRFVAVTAITNLGFQFQAVANAAGAGNARCTYTTVGA